MKSMKFQRILGPDAKRNVLVTFRPRNFLPIVIQHGNIPSIIRTAERDDLILPMSFLPQQLVDLIVQVTNLIIRQTSYSFGQHSMSPELSLE